MKNLLLLLFCSLAVNLGYAQCGDVMPPHQERDFMQATNLVNYSANQNAQNFSQVAEAQFQTVRITLNGNPTLVSARYNPMSGDLQIKENDKVYNIVKANNLEFTFVKSNQTYRALSYINDEGETAIDYFVFDTSTANSDLLKKVDYKYVQPKLAQNSYGANKPGKYKKMESYYVMDNTNRLVSLSTKKKTILKDFPNSAKLILAFIKENKIKDNKEDKLKMLANYIVSLQPATDGTMLASNKP